MENRRRFASLIGPPGLYLFLFFLMPLGVMFIYSFRAGISGVEHDTFTFANYQSFLNNSHFHRLLWQSAGVALAVSLLATLLAYPLAYYLVFRAGPNRITLMTLLIIPTWTSYLLRIFSWKLILGSSGLLNSLLLWLGLVEKTSPILIYSRGAVIVTLIYVWVPFVALPDICRPGTDRQKPSRSRRRSGLQTLGSILTGYPAAEHTRNFGRLLFRADSYPGGVCYPAAGGRRVRVDVRQPDPGSVHASAQLAHGFGDEPGDAAGCLDPGLYSVAPGFSDRSGGFLNAKHASCLPSVRSISW